MSGIQFSPGSVVATPGVLEAFRASGQDPLAYLSLAIGEMLQVVRTRDDALRVLGIQSLHFETIA